MGGRTSSGEIVTDTGVFKNDLLQNTGKHGVKSGRFVENEMDIYLKDPDMSLDKLKENIIRQGTSRVTSKLSNNESKV